MSRYTKDDIFRMVEEEDVEFIRLQFTDIFGTLKNIAITSSQLEKALDNKCMFDGSSVEGFVRIEESDMYLYPDYDTFEIFPDIVRICLQILKPTNQIPDLTMSQNHRTLPSQDTFAISKRSDYRFLGQVHLADTLRQ